MYSNNNYYLPTQTAHQLEANGQKCKNLGLILDKYPPRTAIERDKDNKSGKSDWLKSLKLNSLIDPQLATQVYQRWENATKGMHATHFQAKLPWRMVVGLGGETVLETDLTLHHLYSIPLIPGSALKGLTRAYVTGEITEHKSENIDTDNADIQRIFGAQKKAGSVIFFDALPLDGQFTLELDVMTAHYPKYYGESIPPANNQSPNPVTFLTVARTTFMFALAPRHPADANDVQQAIQWLKLALEHYGVGGKTSAGYGYFTIPALPSDTPQNTPTPYTRPNIPKFVENQGIPGAVIELTDALHQLIPEAKAFLKYREFTAREVLIVITGEEATNWSKGQTKNCVFVREEVHDGCTVLICHPGVKKKKKKKS